MGGLCSSRGASSRRVHAGQAYAVDGGIAEDNTQQQRQHHHGEGNHAATGRFDDELTNIAEFEVSREKARGKQTPSADADVFRDDHPDKFSGECMLFGAQLPARSDAAAANNLPHCSLQQHFKATIQQPRSPWCCLIKTQVQSRNCCFFVRSFIAALKLKSIPSTYLNTAVCIPAEANTSLLCVVTVFTELLKSYAKNDGGPSGGVSKSLQFDTAPDMLADNIAV
jgi:hypothetical protein